MSLQFNGLLPLWLGLSLAVIMSLLSFRYYRRETRTLSDRLRWLLPSLRSAAFLLTVLVLAGPVLHHRTIVGEPGRLDLYLDGSASMQLTDGHMAAERRLAAAISHGWLDPSQTNPDDPAVRAAIAMFDQTPRWQRLEQALTGGRPSLLQQLQERHEVRVLLLQGAQTVPVSPELLSRVTAPTDATQQSLFAEFADATDLSTGLQAASGSGTRRDAVAVLLTDGRHTQGDSPIETARELAAAGTKVVTVSIGAAEEPPDLAILKLEHPESVFRRDQVRGVAVLQDRGPAGAPFVLQIRQGNEVLWQKQETATGTGERRIEFAFGVESLVERLAGQSANGVTLNAVPLALTASIAPLASETSTANNEAPLRLAAVVQRQRVLLLDGRSRWETRYLRNLFERDEQWEVNAVLAGPGVQQHELLRGAEPGRFPENRDQLFGYDLLVLGELDLALLSAAEQRWLRDFVELRGGGLILLDGQRGELRAADPESLGALLPVSWTGGPVSAAVALQLTDRGAADAMLKLAAEDQQNRAFWKQLPPPQALIPVQALPGTEVLVEAELPGSVQPLMVSRRYGAGRVLYLAGDETWRWRYKTADLWHQRIWNQIARSVMARSFSVSSEFLSVDTGPVSYQPGQAVEVRIRLQDAAGKPAVSATVDALVWRGGQVAAAVSLQADDNVPGIYRGRVTGLPAGDYEVSVQAAGYSAEALQARSSFTVTATAAAELRDGSANEGLLRQVAEAGGGQFLREEDLRRLPEILSVYTDGRIVESDTLLWQSYWWFLSILLLLTMEWLLRRRAGLM